MIDDLVAQIERRYKEITDKLSDPEVIADRAAHTELAKRHGELEAAHKLASEYVEAKCDVEESAELLEAGDDDLTADNQAGELGYDLTYFIHQRRLY